ncbi:hypothetical protein [Thiocystis minor]|uniref:hypothetical protein n=1 Tax=Thiocystis minor TaxID=61597 RepID=UPI001A914002|nr:hypothetical protein [Thiocystis minor]
MTARFFADTNVAVYALDTDPQRHERALSIMRRRPVISTQVVNELKGIKRKIKRAGFDLISRYGISST